MSDERSLMAPLQQDAGGSPVVNSANQLVGIVEPVSGNLQKVAGIVPTRAHSIVPVNAVSSLLTGTRRPEVDCGHGGNRGVLEAGFDPDHLCAMTAARVTLPCRRRPTVPVTS